MRAVFAAVLLTLFQLACGSSYCEIRVPDSKAHNGSKYVIARTLEEGDEFGGTETRIITHPRGRFEGTLGFISADMYIGSTWIPLEGMNEVSFTISAHVFTGAVYEADGPTRPDDIGYISLLPKLLASCGSVEEALEWLAVHRVVGVATAALHWALADKTGRSTVLEYLDGERKVYENTPRVMTNDPPITWHWRNLNTYVNLNPHFPHQNDFLGVPTTVGMVPRAVGHGWNLYGLPGDSTPQGRFVQLFFLRNYAMESMAPKNTDDAIVLASALLNRVWIILGTSARNNNNNYTDSPTSKVPWSMIKIPFEERVIIRAYRNHRWREIKLSKLDWTVQRLWHIEDGTLGTKNITNDSVPLPDGPDSPSLV